MNKAKRFFFWVTRGKPMKVIENCAFVDIVSGEAVGIYECRLTGATYLATSPWGMRVKRSNQE